jgi:hypothetical protein
MIEEEYDTLENVDLVLVSTKTVMIDGHYIEKFFRVEAKSSLNDAETISHTIASGTDTEFEGAHKEKIMATQELRRSIRLQTKGLI